MSGLEVLSAGPGVSVQDAGRSGGMGQGLSPGGAADRRGYLSGLALMGAPVGRAAIEMAGMGGKFRFKADTRFALTGAVMRASLDGKPLEWHATHRAAAGQTLDIGAAEGGVYGYLTPGGGIDTEPVLGGRGYHRIADLGQPLKPGDTLPIAADPEPDAPPLRLPPEAAPKGPVRVMPGPQTAFFPDAVLEAFEAAQFTRSPKGNRQGVRMEHDGDPFASGAQLNQVSDFITEGDIQMTGDGTPYVLLADCQTMGGYPRIGTVLAADLWRIAQAGPGAGVTFRFVTVEEAEAAWRSDDDLLRALVKRRERRLRDPREMKDLLSYELIGKPEGEVSGQA